MRREENECSWGVVSSVWNVVCSKGDRIGSRVDGQERINVEVERAGNGGGKCSGYVGCRRYQSARRRATKDIDER